GAKRHGRRKSERRRYRAAGEDISGTLFSMEKSKTYSFLREEKTRAKRRREKSKKKSERLGKSLIIISTYTTKRLREELPFYNLFLLITEKYNA
ncbi:MAG: hypothetical protein J6Z36_00270, partial [Clostridia bacterium]|nr:hypothetical protein [Clostridia bacterium]